MNWLKNLFKSKPTPEVSFGYVDGKTGNCYEGYIDSNNKMKYKIAPCCKTQVWEKYSIITENWVRGTKYYTQNYIREILVEKNSITGEFRAHYLDNKESVDTDILKLQKLL